jgi:hypothetical protein
LLKITRLWPLLPWLRLPLLQNQQPLLTKLLPLLLLR